MRDSDAAQLLAQIERYHRGDIDLAALGLQVQRALDFGRAFAALGECAYAQARARGFDDHALSFGDQIAELHGEISEAFESYRKHGFDDYYSIGADSARRSKPEGVRTELADVLIRLAHIARARDLDLGAKVAEKLLYNETRSHRHGGKLP